MTNFLVILTSLLIGLPTDPVTPASAPEKTPAQLIEQMPAPLEGMAALMKAVKYPDAAKKDGIEGIVMLKLTIDPTGKVTKSEIITSVRADLDQAAIDGARSIVWRPGKDDEGKAIEASVFLPVSFKLEEKC